MTQAPVRFQSEIPGLDAALCGGLIHGASYIVQGSPGAGKTILANQIAFATISRGEKVLYVTLLAESHERMFQSLSAFDFYDAARNGQDIIYISLFKILKNEGLDALVLALRKELARTQCSMLVLDGLLIAKDKAESALDVKTFVAELQIHAAFTGCTVLFLTSARVDEVSPEHTMVDGVIQLQETLVGTRTIRNLRISKSRGSAALAGLHQYDISGKGIRVYPRLEALHAHPTNVEPVAGPRMSAGVSGFDGLLGDGLPPASVTLLVGPPGSGKTTFGLNFLSLANAEEPALYFGFYESPARLEAKARALALNFESGLKSGAIQFIWNPLTENLLDSLGHQLLQAVRERGVRRLVIDGLAGFERAALFPARLTEFYAALMNELRALGVTTIATLEMSDTDGTAGTLPMPDHSSLMDSLVSLRQRFVNGRLSKLLAVVKVRDSAFDARLHLIEIGRGGLAVKGPFDSPATATHPAEGAHLPFSRV